MLQFVAAVFVSRCSILRSLREAFENCTARVCVIFDEAKTCERYKIVLCNGAIACIICVKLYNYSAGVH